jgi:hypothetical protein
MHDNLKRMQHTCVIAQHSCAHMHACMHISTHTHTHTHARTNKHAHDSRCNILARWRCLKRDASLRWQHVRHLHPVPCPALCAPVLGPQLDLQPDLWQQRTQPQQPVRRIDLQIHTHTHAHIILTPTTTPTPTYTNSSHTHNTHAPRQYHTALHTANAVLRSATSNDATGRATGRWLGDGTVWKCGSSATFKLGRAAAPLPATAPATGWLIVDLQPDLSEVERVASSHRDRMAVCDEEPDHGAWAGPGG